MVHYGELDKKTGNLLVKAYKKGFYVIYIFRKEMKRWYSVLWVVFVSLGLSGLGMFFFRTKHLRDTAVAHVNGSPITFQEFKRARQDIQEQINRVLPLARMYGMSPETLLTTFFGDSNPDQIAMDLCVRRELVDIVGNKFDVALNKDYLKKELIKSLPPQFIDANGTLNMEVYRSSLERMHMTPVEFEQRKADDLKREMVQRFIRMSGYVPAYMIEDTIAQEHTHKAFTVVTFELEPFINQAKKTPIAEKELSGFYEKNKEEYRVGEKAKAIYWKITPEIYGQSIVVDNAMIETFYEKNKETAFRILPQVKVRHILVKGSGDESRIKAEKIHQDALKDAAGFANIAKSVDVIIPGAFDSALEKAAFRLQEVGSFAAVTKVKDGYEVIQLVERTKASSKPLASVREEIVKLLKGKRSYNVLRSDLELMVRAAKEDASVVDRFIAKHGLEGKTGPLMVEGDREIKPASFDALLSNALFSKQRKESPIGYFMHEKEFVLYKKIESEKSYVPALDAIKQSVTNDYYKQKGVELQAKELVSAKKDLLIKKTTLQEVAKAYSGKVVDIPLHKKMPHIKELGNSGLRGETLFTLSDTAQVLLIVSPQLTILAQCTAFSPQKTEELEKLRLAARKKEKNITESMNLSAFIASLNRNAKIEIDSKVMQKTTTELN